MSDHDEIPPVPRWMGSGDDRPGDPGNERPARPVPPTEPRPAAAPWAGSDPNTTGPTEEFTTGEPERPEEARGGDESVGDVAARVRDALVGRDLLRPGPGLWPFGKRARARRERAQEVAAEAKRRRAALRESIAPVTGSPVPLGDAWRPVDRRRNAGVIASLVAVVVLVFAASWWFGRNGSSQQLDPAASVTPTVTTTSTSTSSTSSAAGPTEGTSLPGRPPIPSGGVAPISPPANKPTDPAGVALVAAPTGEPSRDELNTPEGAMRAWLARLCPYSFTDEYGARENRARAAMTSTGWTALDPSKNDRARVSWSRVVESKESAQCSAPAVVISPEAPRGETNAIVVGTISQVVSTGAGTRWVESLDHTRIVLRGTDGLWRVDTETQGG